MDFWKYIWPLCVLGMSLVWLVIWAGVAKLANRWSIR